MVYRMKHSRGVKCFAVITVVLFVGIASNIQNPSEDYSIEKRFTFICPFRWSQMGAGIAEADREFHSDTKCYSTTTTNSKKQAEQILYAVESGVDGIITAGTEDSQELTEALLKAKAAGIPVVLVDCDLENSGRYCYIGINNYKAGRTVAQDLIKVTDGKTNVLCVIVSEETKNQIERIQGFKDEISEYSDIKIIDILPCYSDSSLIKEKITEALQKNPDIDSIFCAEGSSFRLVGGILEEMGEKEKNIHVVGFEAKEPVAEYLQKGIYDAAVVQPYYEEGYMAVKILNEITEGKASEEKRIILEASNYFSWDNLNELNINEENEAVKWYQY